MFVQSVGNIENVKGTVLLTTVYLPPNKWLSSVVNTLISFARKGSEDSLGKAMTKVEIRGCLLYLQEKP